MQALFNAIQEACTKTTWSRGVELVRADAVTSEGTIGDGHVSAECGGWSSRWTRLQRVAQHEVNG